MIPLIIYEERFCSEIGSIYDIYRGELDESQKVKNITPTSYSHLQIIKFRETVVKLVKEEGTEVWLSFRKDSLDNEIPKLERGYLIGRYTDSKDVVIDIMRVDTRYFYLLCYSDISIPEFHFTKEEALNRYTEKVAELLNRLTQERQKWKKELISEYENKSDLFKSLIALTNVELKKLHWSDQKRTDHLIKTYKKRSRQVLSENELIDFYCYLRFLSN